MDPPSVGNMSKCSFVRELKTLLCINSVSQFYSQTIRSNEVNSFRVINCFFFLSFFPGMEGKMERLSTQTQESGFVSMHSQRSSSQSYTTGSSTTSKRSSQQSSSSYNSQSFSTQQQSFSQSKLSSDSNGSIFTQKTMTSSKSTISTTNTSGSGDPALLEKLVNLCYILFLFSFPF